jgi:hypothetical protein
MGIGVAVGLLLAASAPAAASAPPATAYGPAAPAPPPKKVISVSAPTTPCPTRTPAPGQTDIVICAQKPQGYRIDPDVMKAKRNKAKNASRPPRPNIMKDNSCATIGPMGCRGNPGIDLVNAVAVLGKMVDKISKGENVGEMFVTDPQPDEYQLYVEAKRAREAKEAEELAAAKAKAAKEAAPPPADLTAKATTEAPR